MALWLRVAVSCAILPQECSFGFGRCFFGTEAEELRSFVKFAGAEWTQTVLWPFSAVYSESGKLRSGRGEITPSFNQLKPFL